MRTFGLACVLCWGAALAASPPLSAPPTLDPYETQAIMASGEEVLCASAGDGFLYLLRSQEGKEVWSRILELDPEITVSDLDAAPEMGGATIAFLLSGVQCNSVAFARLWGQQTSGLWRVRTFPKEEFPRNLKLVSLGEDDRVALYALSRRDYRDRIQRNSWDKLMAVRIRSGVVLWDKELGSEDAVGRNSFAAFAGPRGTLGLVRQRYRNGTVEVVLWYLSLDGKAKPAKTLLTLKPSGKREDWSLALDAAVDGSEVRALLSERGRSTFYRVAPDGSLLQRESLEKPYIFLGYDGKSLLAADRNSPTLHWLNFSRDQPCDETFEYPPRCLRIRQPAAECRWWIEPERQKEILRCYCRKGC